MKRIRCTECGHLFEDNEAYYETQDWKDPEYFCQSCLDKMSLDDMLETFGLDEHEIREYIKWDFVQHHTFED